MVYEKKGNTQLHYFYDINGSLKGIQTLDSTGVSTNYYVITNTRGDVTQIYDAAGSLQVLYTYDSWVKVLSMKDAADNDITSDTNIGNLNSLRYRSYYFDTETGLYYLQSRYYNPEWQRFINADDASMINYSNELLTNNLFSYVENNPVNKSDPDGHFSGVIAQVGERALIVLFTAIAQLGRTAAIQVLVSLLPSIAAVAVVVVVAVLSNAQKSG